MEKNVFFIWMAKKSSLQIDERAAKSLINFSCCFQQNFMLIERDDERGQRKQSMGRSTVTSACAFSSKIYCDWRSFAPETYNEEIEEMKNFVFGVFTQLVAFPFPPRMQQNNKETFRYYLFCFIVVAAFSWGLMMFTKRSLVTGGLNLVLLHLKY